MQVKLDTLDYGAIVAYMLAVVLVGLWFSKNEENSEDFLLGGRKLPWLAVGISCLMSLLSTYSLVMVPGEIFNNGLSLWILSLINPLLSIFAVTIFIKFYFKLGAFTPFEYLEKRYDKRVRALIAGLYTYGRIVYLAMVLFSTSKVFEGGAGWPAWQTITVVGIIGIVYTVMGGMKAVVWTDVLQFVVLVGGIGYAVVVLITKIDGGAVEAVRYTFAEGHGLSRFSEASFYKLNPYVRLSFWLLLLGQLTAPFSAAASDQITIQRLLSTSSYKNAFKAQLASSLMTIPFLIILWFIGMAVFTFYGQNPNLIVKGGDTAFFTFVSTQLPAPIPGLIMAAMLAAVMSTLDSGINSLATIWLKEVHQKYINPKIIEKKQVYVSRIATAVIGIIAVGFGLVVTCTSEQLGQSVVEAATIFQIFDAIIFPAFLFAVLSRCANSILVWVTAAVLWGLKCGMLTWYTLSKNVVHNWEPGQEFGLGGAISLWWVLVPVLISLAVLTCWIARKKTTGRFSVSLLAISLFPFGYAIATTIWYISSNIGVTDKPLALSFQWAGFPVFVTYILFGVVGLYVSKKQPREKYQGLILFEKE